MAYPNPTGNSRPQLPYYTADFATPDPFTDINHISHENDQPASQSKHRSTTAQHAILPVSHPFFETQRTLIDDQIHANERQEDDDADFEPSDENEEEDELLTPSPSPPPSTSISARSSGRPRGRPRSKRGVSKGHGGRQAKSAPRGGTRRASTKIVSRSLRVSDDDARVGRPRGQPVKQPDPGPEYHQAQMEANTAMIDKDFEAAKEALGRAIQINPEVFNAYVALAEISLLEERPSEAIDALTVGAFTMKSNINIWRSLVETLERHAELYPRQELLEKLQNCYSNIIRIDPRDISSRHARISIYLERDQRLAALSGARNLLKYSPFDLIALSVFAESASDPDTLQEGLKLYRAAVTNFEEKHVGSGSSELFRWSDLNSYVGLLLRLGSYQEALVQLKHLARALLGRQHEMYWDAYIEDDREFDESDEPRRAQVPEFRSKQRHNLAYGMELPPEIRAKLGVLRLKRGDRAEALMHFEFFEPESTAANPPAKAFPGPSREIADALVECDETFHAVRFLDAIFAEHSFGHDDTKRYRTYAKTLLKEQRVSDAIRAYARLIRKQPGSWQDRLDLAAIYETRGDAGDEKRAVGLVREVLRQNRAKEVASSGLRSAGRLLRSRSLLTRAVDADAARRDGALADAEIFAELEIGPDRNAALDAEYLSQMPIGRAGAGIGRSAKKYKRLKLDQESSQRYYNDLHSLTAEFVEGESDCEASIPAWLEAAVPLTSTYLEQHALSEAIINLSEYKPQHSGAFIEGVSSSQWLGIVCQTCLVLATYGDRDDINLAQKYMTDAERVPEFFHQEELLQRLHLCQVLCSALASNEDGMLYATRWFTSSFGHMSDTYALTSLLPRYCNKPQDTAANKHKRGIHQKYWLRHVKWQDFALMTEEQRRIFDFKEAERRAYSKRPDRVKVTSGIGSNGNPQGLKDADPSLFMFYGDMLNCTGSFANSLNYYMRAYQARPNDPLVLLSIASAYVQLSLKRTTENRQWDILTGLSLFQAYAKARREQSRESTPWLRAQREIEVLYNEGRILHSLGLAHLAYEAYERCLAVRKVTFGDEDEAAGLMQEADFKTEAALALQNIMWLAGNVEGAREIGQQWLVF